MRSECLKRLCPPFAEHVVDFISDLTRSSRAFFKQEDWESESDGLRIFSDYVDLFQTAGVCLVECASAAVRRRGYTDANLGRLLLASSVDSASRYALLTDMQERYLAFCSKKRVELLRRESQEAAERAIENVTEEDAQRFGEVNCPVWIGGKLAGGLRARAAACIAFHQQPRLMDFDAEASSDGIETRTKTTQVDRKTKLVFRFLQKGHSECLYVTTLCDGDEITGDTSGSEGVESFDTRRRLEKIMGKLTRRRETPWRHLCGTSPHSIAAFFSRFFHQHMLLLLPAEGSSHGMKAALASPGATTRSLSKKKNTELHRAQDVNSFQSLLHKWTGRQRETARTYYDDDITSNIHPRIVTHALLRIFPRQLRQEISHRFGEGDTRKGHHDIFAFVSKWVEENAIDHRSTRRTSAFCDAFVLEIVPCPEATCGKPMMRCGMQLARSDEASTGYWRCESCLVSLDDRKRKM